MQNTHNSNEQSALAKGHDSRGDRISAKREAKRIFKKEFGITSGRQYRRMRKALQRGQLDEHNG